MKTNSPSEFGFFRPRALLACALGCVGIVLAMAALASTPATGGLTPTSAPLTYSAGPFNTPNASPLGAGQLDTGPRCNTTTFPCDNYTLTVTVPTGYLTTHPYAAVKVTAGWIDGGTGSSDYDLYVYKGVVATTDGSMPADYQSASGSNPEIASISPLTEGTKQYSIKIVPYTPTGETLQVKIEFLPGSTATGGGGGVAALPFGGLDTTAPGKPRFQTFAAPKGTSAESSNGEFNIGYNPQTGRIMTMNTGPIWRITPPEVMTPPKPECCEALWEDKSSTVTDTGLDPILWVDQLTGRTFASNSTAGANAVYAYSDNDGDSYIPIGAAPPNGGADHQTIGSGPYPASALYTVFANPSNPVTHGHAVYYCSQDVVGPASCARSDTLGSSYGPGVLAYTGNGLPQITPGIPGGPCGGLHGHLHVAPDGTAWLPVNQCGGLQGGVFSTDGGLTWVNFTVPNALSQTNGSDPSIAIDADSTVYYSYVNNEPVTTGNPLEGHARVQVGHRNTDNTVTWSRNFDLGATHGIVNAAEIEAAGGSSGRAAVGFLATNIPGDYQNLGFPGKWYAYIATTYDGGVSWTTVNATPNDPVQSLTGVWQQGGGAQDRNLLDFNEMSVDKYGRVLYGYSDGCVSEGCIGATAANDFVGFMRVARQNGGKSLFASYDQFTDTTTALVPKPACLSGTRSATTSFLTWRAPDNGGADIVNYQVFRGTSAGNEILIGQTGNAKPAYNDTTAGSVVPNYYYVVKAINAVGTGLQSNEILLPITPLPPVENVCALPGRTVLTDATGDNVPPTAGTDLHSFQISQPYSADGVLRLGFTINTDAGISPQPTNSAWYVAMKLVNGATTTYKAVHMTYKAASPTQPTFESYTPSPNNSGTVDGRFVTSGTEIPAQTGSAYDTVNGKITIIVKASDLGLSAGETIAGFVSGVTLTTDVGGTGGVTQTVDAMPDSLAYTGLYTIQSNSSCGPASLLLAAVGSRKTHGSAGTFDVDLPLTGNPGIECRNGGANGTHTVVFTFNAPLVSVGSASVSNGTGSVSSSAIDSNDLRQYVVNLTGVANAQTITVSLANVTDSLGAFSSTVSVPMAVLAGDTNADRSVNSTDISQTNAQSGIPVSSANFREDVTFDGSVNSSDAAFVKSKSGTALPGNRTRTRQGDRVLTTADGVSR